jgi:phage terminase small subunit
MYVLTVRNLSPKEEAFCLAIVEGMSESDAYRKAYRPQRAKAKTIHEMASRLMAKDKVRARVAELMQPVIQRARMTREQWVEALASICFADVRKMFDVHGNPVEITDLGANEAAAVAAFEVCEDFSGTGEARKTIGYTRRVKMADKLKALELYGKAMAYSAEREPGEAAAASLAVTVNFVDPRPSVETDHNPPTINLQPKFIR